MHHHTILADMQIDEQNNALFFCHFTEFNLFVNLIPIKAEMTMRNCQKIGHRLIQPNNMNS